MSGSPFDLDGHQEGATPGDRLKTPANFIVMTVGPAAA